MECIFLLSACLVIFVCFLHIAFILWEAGDFYIFKNILKFCSRMQLSYLEQLWFFRGLLLNYYMLQEH